MIDHFNNLLRHLFMMRVTHLRPTPADPPGPPNNNVLETQVRFEPPDDDWRQHVSGLGTRQALNIYLADLRENRKLRSNERVRSFDNGSINETPAPRRIDCHFLITAWSPATAAAAVEPALDEQALLYEVTGVLMQSEPLVASKVYGPDPLPATFPEAIADAELPTAILPVEGFPKYAEFWGTMGLNHRWKPAVYLVVTLPVILQTAIAGPMVTTRITEYRRTGESETAEVWVQIAGTVFKPDGQPAAEAWVRLEPGAHMAITGADGRFTFIHLRSGDYQLRARARGFDEVSEPIQVPSPGGGYDVQL